MPWLGMLNVNSSMPDFTPISARVGVSGPQTKNFTQISEYKRPAREYPSGYFFYQIFTICVQFYEQSCVKIWTTLLNGFLSYGVLSLGVCV